MITELNLNLLLWINSLAAGSDFWKFFSIFFAEYVIYAVIIGWILFSLFIVIVGRYSTHKSHIEILAVSAISSLIARFIITELIRIFYQNPRPFEVVPEINKLVEHSFGGSFPSGHTSFMFGLAVAVSLYHRRAGIAFLLLALLVGIARVAVGVHWPLDIIGGVLVGTGSAFFAKYLWERVLSFRLMTKLK